MTWACAECGHEEEERWLMCPECTTAEDWAEARISVEAAILNIQLDKLAKEGAP